MNILICIPSHNQYVHAKLMTTLMSYDFTKHKANISISLKTGSLISRLRNEYMTDFLYDERYSHLLFIDNDLFDFHDTLYKMLISGKKVIGGVYRKKTNVEQYNINLLDSIEQSLKYPYCECKHIATGLLLIHRSVVEDMSIKLKDRRYIHCNKTYFDFFPCFIKNNRYLSEDYGFCELYREIGGKVYAVIDSEITHNGIINYRGNFKNYLNKIISK